MHVDNIDDIWGDEDEDDEDDEHDGDGEPEWVRTERDQFANYRDKDGNGMLDKEEIKEWIIPEDYDHSTAEAAHLLRSSDDDGVSMHVVNCNFMVGRNLKNNAVCFLILGYWSDFYIFFFVILGLSCSLCHSILFSEPPHHGQVDFCAQQLHYVIQICFQIKTSTKHIEIVNPPLY